MEVEILTLSARRLAYRACSASHCLLRFWRVCNGSGSVFKDLGSEPLKSVLPKSGVAARELTGGPSDGSTGSVFAALLTVCNILAGLSGLLPMSGVGDRVLRMGGFVCFGLLAKSGVWLRISRTVDLVWGVLPARSGVGLRASLAGSFAWLLSNDEAGWLLLSLLFCSALLEHFLAWDGVSVAAEL